MANQADKWVHVPFVRKKEELDVQHRKVKLEKEVFALHQVLDHETKVHEILEQAIHHPNGSNLPIPNFLPPKTKELLAELATVDNEIIRLENEINYLQQGLSPNQEVSKEQKTKKWQSGNLSNIHEHQLPVLPNPRPTFIGMHERVPFEPKALYFISKAIKGDSPLNGFASNEKKEISEGITTDQKENHKHEELIRFHEKVSSKSGIQQKPPPPKIAPRHSSMPMELGSGTSVDFPPKPIPNSSPLEGINNHKLQANKLSESIMKNLIFIYVRLMRTSRAHEIEKSSNISRTSHSSYLSSRSFRVDTAGMMMNSKASLSLQRESKQQDPYGIFEIEESIPRDIGPYKNLVRFTSSSLDPKCINSSSFIPLIQRLRVLMNHLQIVDLRFLTHQQKLAFWINMYNACIMHGFLQYGAPSSPENLLALMNKATLKIGGKNINALTIERFILRQPTSSTFKDVSWKGLEEYDKEATAYSIYGLESFEPNVTFALCFGTRSSPSVRIYTTNGISTELEKAKLEYLQASIVVTTTKRFIIPELLFQNMHNFAHDVESLIEWICHQLPTSWSLRKSMVECFRTRHNGRISNIVDRIPYDFEFQYLLAI